MPIQSNQIILRRGGAINADQTLCTIFNDYIKNNSSSKMGFKIINVDFLSQLTTQPLSLRLKIKATNTLTQSNHNINQFKKIFRLNDDSIEVINNTITQTREINISDVPTIISLFQKINYESLLNSDDICLAYKVDLLQLLITDTLSWLIKKSKITPHAPEVIEFNTSGDLTAIVISPNNKKYQLKNMGEICGFFKQYCNFELPSHFIGLMRQQQKINAARSVRYLTSPTNNGIPRIFADNQLNEAKVCVETQTISFDLIRKDNGERIVNPQERRIFQMLFEYYLGSDFVTRWHLNVTNYQLILSSTQPKKLTTDQITTLQNVLTRFNLLPQLLIDNCISALEQAPKSSIFRDIPESIATILRCPISYALPKDTPYITPTGQSYDQESIKEWLTQRPVDPMNPSSNLTFSMLRKNELLKQLITYYHSVSPRDALANPPSLLMSNKTDKIFYKNPVVTPTGETNEYMEFAIYPKYVNRSILDLIKFYEVTLNPRNEAIVRTGIRATIGANLGLICPGDGALSEAIAKDEAETSLPYPEYDGQSDTLTVHFISQEYARRFELALLQWKKEQSLVFANDEVVRETMQTSKTILDVHEEKKELIFNAHVLIRGKKNILNILEHLCKLPATHYFNALKKLSALSDSEELLNEITHATLLQNCKYDWSNTTVQFNSPYSTMPLTSNNNILSVRAAADRARLYLSGLEVIYEETNEELDDSEELDSSRLIIPADIQANEEETPQNTQPSVSSPNDNSDARCTTEIRVAKLKYIPSLFNNSTEETQPTSDEPNAKRRRHT